MSHERWSASPILGVRDVRQAAEYYRDTLGFHLDPVNGVLQTSAEEPGGVYGIVKRGNVWVHFQIRRGEVPERERGAFERDVYFYVTDLDALHKELVGRGARIKAPPRMAHHGMREMIVEDLNGYVLAFGQV